jgi:hypothetical protein
VLAVSGVLERPVFTVGRRQFRWADVADRLDWEALKRSASVPPSGVSEAELTDAEARFRYERSLVAAEEMEAWLDRWELTVGEWRDYLRGTLARDERAAWITAVCSGTLERAAHELAAKAVAAEATGEPDLDRAYERFVSDAVTPEALRSLLDTRKADWIRVDCRTLLLQTEAAAREAALCVRDDGMALAEVAAQAGVEMREHSLYLEDAADELGKALLSARTGELLGPVPLADRFALVLVDDKVEPTLDDPEILRRVQEAARRRAIEREVVNRVTWHERV